MEKHTIRSLPGRTVKIEGREWLYFSGTAYLGIVQNPAFLSLVKQGIDRYGVHYGGSRLASIELDLFEKAELFLSQLTGAPAALTVSSGSMAGQLAVRAFRLRYSTEKLSFAPGVHPALRTENDQVFPGHFEDWVEYLMETVSRTSRQLNHPRVWFANTLDTLHARSYDFSWINQIPEGRETYLVIDDSHGFGINGPKGAGIYPTLNPPPHVKVIISSSLGKAFGIPGGFLLGPAPFIQQIRALPFFGGASPPPPAFLYAFLEGQENYQQARQALMANIAHFKSSVQSTGLFQSIENHPVFYTPAVALGEYLSKRQVLLSQFPYPTPLDQLLTRVVINSQHTAEDLNKLGHLISEFHAITREEKRKGK